MGGLLLTSASSSRIPTANPDRDFKEILPGSPTAVREFPSGDELAIAVDVYDNKVATPHRVEIRTTVTADDGNVVFNSTDERKSEELKGVNAPTAMSRRFLSRASRLAATSSVSKPSRSSPRTRAPRARWSSPYADARGRDTRAGEDSRLVEPRRFLIRDRKSFSAVWAAHAGPAAAVPAVDFDSRMVAAVFAGERPSAGFSIGDRHTPRAPGRWRLRARGARRRAGARSARVAAQIIVSPFHIATLPRDDGKIRFSLPDPAGQQTMIFKAPPRAHATPASAPTTPSAMTEAGAPPAALEEVSSFTGLRPHVAGSLAYLAGPLSGALLLAVEPASQFVRFHAWQSVVGLGGLALAAVSFLFLAFVLLLVSPAAFWTMLWMAAITAVAWVGVWAVSGQRVQGPVVEASLCRWAFSYHPSRLLRAVTCAVVASMPR